MYISCILTFPSLLTICMFPLAFFKFDNKEQSVFKQSKLICMFKQSYVTICFSVAIVVVLFYKSGAAVYIGNLSVSAHRDWISAVLFNAITTSIAMALFIWNQMLTERKKKPDSRNPNTMIVVWVRFLHLFFNLICIFFSFLVKQHIFI